MGAKAGGCQGELGPLGWVTLDVGRPQSSGGCQEVRTVAAVSLTGVRLAGRLPLRDPTAISPKQILQYLPLP